MRRALLKGLAILLLLAVAAVLAGRAYLRSSLPQLEGTVQVSGISGPVDIIRDRDAVTHVFAATRLDTFYGLGYAHAQDRLWQMELKELTMSKICFAMLMLVTVVARVVSRTSPCRLWAPGLACGGSPIPGRPDCGLPAPSCRCAGRQIFEGMQGPGDCQACGHQLYCADWKLMPWFGSWDEPHSHGCGHGGAGCSTCGQ